MFSEDTTIENRMDVGNLRRTHICLLKRGCFSDLGLSMKVKSVTYLVDKKNSFTPLCRFMRHHVYFNENFN